MKFAKAVFLFCVVFCTATLSSGAISSGNTSGGSGFTWGVGVGGSCRDVVDRIRRNWMDVKGVIAPDSKTIRPRSRDFYCISPGYTQSAHPKPVSMLSGLRCYELSGKGFCCDDNLQQCATM